MNWAPSPPYFSADPSNTDHSSMKVVPRYRISNFSTPLGSTIDDDQIENMVHRVNQHPYIFRFVSAFVSDVKFRINSIIELPHK